MAEINFCGFEKKVINSVSGKVLFIKSVSIPNEDCNDFFIKYEISDTNSQKRNIGTHVCLVSPYQRDISHVFVNKSIYVPEEAKLELYLESKNKPNFRGNAKIEYEIFEPDLELSISDNINIIITERDRENAFKIALKNIARFFNVENWEFDENQELYTKLKMLNEPIIKYLDQYLNAYNKWFEFYAKINKYEIDNKMKYTLPKNEKYELASLIRKRVESLNLLQEEFDRLQLDRFQKRNGMGNINGLIS